MKDIQARLEAVREEVQLLEELAALEERKAELERKLLLPMPGNIIFPLGKVEQGAISVTGTSANLSHWGNEQFQGPDA